MFLHQKSKSYSNREIYFLCAPSMAIRINSSQLTQFLKQHEEQGTEILSFFKEHKEEKNNLKYYLDMYQRYTNELKKICIDYQLRLLSEESILGIYKFLHLPYEKRLEIASFLKQSKVCREALALEHPKYAEILLAPCLVREYIIEKFEKKIDELAIREATLLFSYLGPLLPFDEQKYHENLRMQSYYRNTYQKKYKEYTQHLAAFKLHILNYYLLDNKNLESQSLVINILESTMNEIEEKLTASYRKNDGVEEDYGQFENIDLNDFSICEIQNHAIHSPVSVVTSEPEQSVYQLGLNADELFYLPSVFHLKF
jgi:hypothetical protein